MYIYISLYPNFLIIDVRPKLDHLVVLKKNVSACLLLFLCVFFKQLIFRLHSIFITSFLLYFSTMSERKEDSSINLTEELNERFLDCAARGDEDEFNSLLGKMYNEF